MKVKNLLYRNINDLNPKELDLYWITEDINTCDKYNTIHYTNDLYWNSEYNLKGDYEALCQEAYNEVGGECYAS